MRVETLIVLEREDLLTSFYIQDMKFEDIKIEMFKQYDKKYLFHCAIVLFLDDDGKSRIIKNIFSEIFKQLI